jgi:hypothetical protein
MSIATSDFFHYLSKYRAKEGGPESVKGRSKQEKKGSVILIFSPAGMGWGTPRTFRNREHVSQLFDGPDCQK